MVFLMEVVDSVDDRDKLIVVVKFELMEEPNVAVN